MHSFKAFQTPRCTTRRQERRQGAQAVKVTRPFQHAGTPLSDALKAANT